MSQKLTIKAFFFNAQTDYLAYYKHFTINLHYDAKVEDLLLAIHTQNENFSYPTSNLVFKINNKIVQASTPMRTVIEKLGTTLQIDPANSYRANNGLIINDDDFMQSYALLEPYVTGSDEAYYKTLYALHYASETEKFEHTYIGDAILVLAHKMLKEGNLHKEAILKAITSTHSSLLDCEYENNLLISQDHTATITALKEMLTHDDNEHPSLLDMLRTRFGKAKGNQENNIVLQKPRVDKDVEALEYKHIAYYAATYSRNEAKISQLIRGLGTKEVHFSRKNKLSGLSLLKDNKNLALQKAGATLLDAYDSGAEVLVVEDEACLEMFQTYFKQIEKTVGRKMQDLDLISAKGFILQSQAITAT
jgi:hypothetical protein